MSFMDLYLDSRWPLGRQTPDCFKQQDVQTFGFGINSSLELLLALKKKKNSHIGARTQNSSLVHLYDPRNGPRLSKARFE